MSAPWKCPDCQAWIAPHVSEHRCDPPESGVTVTPFAPAGSGGTSGTTLPPGTVVTYNVTGSGSGRDLARVVRPPHAA